MEQDRDDVSLQKLDKKKQGEITKLFRWKAMFPSFAIDDLRMARHNCQESTLKISVGRSESKRELLAQINKEDIRKNPMFQKFKKAAAEKCHNPIDVEREPTLDQNELKIYVYVSP